VEEIKRREKGPIGGDIYSVGNVWKWPKKKRDSKITEG
jgi:hypothetical protein